MLVLDDANLNFCKGRLKPNLFGYFHSLFRAVFTHPITQIFLSFINNIPNQTCMPFPTKIDIQSHSIMKGCECNNIVKFSPFNFFLMRRLMSLMLCNGLHNIIVMLEKWFTMLKIWSLIPGRMDKKHYCAVNNSLNFSAATNSCLKCAVVAIKPVIAAKTSHPFQNDTRIGILS